MRKHADPNDVLALLAVVEHRGFRGAERALGIPKSTLSQRVRALEEHLGARLLARTTRTSQLTELGESYVREVAPAIAALQSAEALVSRLSAKPSGRLRVTAPFELGQSLLGRILARYVQRYPDVKLELELLDRPVDLVTERYDLGIRVGPLADSSLIARKLGDPQHVGLYASPSYLRRAGKPQAPSDLVHHRCLVMSSARTPSSWTFRDGRKLRTLAIQAHASANSFRLLAELAAGGAGIARIARPHVASVLERGEVVEVLGTFAPPPYQVFAVYSSARHVTPALRAMVELLTAGFDTRLP
jgi:DNA-binding transcriptional LysR family regulator